MKDSETQTAKKRRERAALRRMYDERSYARIDAGDRPDFLLCHTPTSVPFGVEVTELHPSESAARLTHVPGYALGLIDGAPFRHKDDAKRLAVDAVEFTSPDGRKVAGRAVAHDGLALDDYRGRLEAIVRDKTKKAQKFRTDITHCNLLIVDHAATLVLVKNEGVYTAAFAEGVRSAIVDAPFREMYLLTRVKLDPLKSGEDVYIPLRTLFLFASVFLFRSALKVFSPDYSLKTTTQLLLAVGTYLTTLGLSPRVHVGTDGHELVLNHSSVRITRKGGYLIHDNADCAPHIVDEVGCDLQGPWCNPGFEEAFKAYRQKTILKIPAAFPLPYQASAGAS